MTNRVNDTDSGTLPRIGVDQTKQPSLQEELAGFTSEELGQEIARRSWEQVQLRKRIEHAQDLVTAGHYGCEVDVTEYPFWCATHSVEITGEQAM